MKTLTVFIEELKAERRYLRARIIDRTTDLENQARSLHAWLHGQKISPTTIPMPDVFKAASDIRDWALLDSMLARLIIDAERDVCPT